MHCFSEVCGGNLDDSGLAATPRCCPPIIAQHPSDVTRRHDNSSPSSTSSSHESGIRSTTDSSSPEHHTRHHHHHQYNHQYHHYWQQQQQTATTVESRTPDDGPLDLSVTSSLPRQRINDDKAAIVQHRTATPRDNTSLLSALSFVEESPLLSNTHCAVAPPDVTRRHDNRNSLSAVSLVDEKSPLLSNAHWLLQPQPVFHQSMTVHVMPLTHDGTAETNTRLSESAKLLLTSWYETHVRHPYPQPDELSQLVMMTGQSRRKILKWLANRRARTGNTLPHNGSVHPRKIVKIRQLRQQLDTQTEPSHRPTRRGRGSGGLRSSRFLPEPVVDGLQRWYDDHLGYPYPTDAEKRHLAEQLGTTVVKVTNWFANKRNRSGHAKSAVNARLHDTSASLSAPSTLDWRYNLARFPQTSLPALTIVPARHWNDQGHLLWRHCTTWSSDHPRRRHFVAELAVRQAARVWTKTNAVSNFRR